MAENHKILTHLERTCLQSVAQGEPVGVIAQRNGRTSTEIESLLTSARRKLTANTNVEAIARALKLGLME